VRGILLKMWIFLYEKSLNSKSNMVIMGRVPLKGNFQMRFLYLKMIKFLPKRLREVQRVFSL